MLDFNSFTTEKKSKQSDEEVLENSTAKIPHIDDEAPLTTENPLNDDFTFTQPSETAELNDELSQYYGSQSNTSAQLKFRSTEPLTAQQYYERLKDLNDNAENKHFVLFFGKPASGKTWVIGSLLHYMKNYLEGVVYLNTEKSSVNEQTLFFQLQDCFNGLKGTDKITRTDTQQYFEFHIRFEPKDPRKAPVEFTFIDASGEHSEEAFMREQRSSSGKLPNYLTAYLESNAHTHLAFVYDQSLPNNDNSIPQVNVLSAIFTQIQHIQNKLGKRFPKVLLLSKYDRILSSDLAAVERNDYDAMHYAIEKIPAFAQSFFHEAQQNSTIFYKIGIFSSNSDLLLEFEEKSPRKLFEWFYQGATGEAFTPPESCWSKFKSWFLGGK